MQSYQRFFNVCRRRFTPTIINIRLFSQKPTITNISKFDHIFGKYLWLTNTLVSGVLLAVGDGIQQQFEICFEEKKDIDWMRISIELKFLNYFYYAYVNFFLTVLGNMFIVGTIIGLPQHYFYYFMDKTLPKTNWKTVKYKILLDQVIASPACIFLFLTGMELSQGNTYKQALEEFKNKFFSIFIVSILSVVFYYLFIQFLIIVNFRLI